MSECLVIELSEIETSRVQSFGPVTIITSHIKWNDLNKDEKKDSGMSVKVPVNYSGVKEVHVIYVSFGLDDVIYFENNILMNLAPYYYG